MNCSNCQASLPANAKFCTQCGTKASITCQACQAECLVGSKFCTQCGTAMVARQTSQNAGDRRVVTVLFTDVSGFTSMSEKLDAGRVTEIVNQFFEVLTEPIYRYGGVVDKYIGDAIMALFGAPVAHEDDPERAVHAAFEMQRVAKEFSEQLEARTGIGLKVRIGLNTGLVVAGAVGGEQKRDYTVMGDTVNLAQRMESAARPGKVLVTNETYRLTSEAFEFQEMPAVEVQGKSQSIPVFELVGPRHTGRDIQRERIKLVNRKRELDNMALSYERTCEGFPQLVEVVGDAGIGKSHLVAHFVQTRCVPAPTILRARCQSYTSTASFGIVSGLINYWLDSNPTMGSVEVRRRLQDFCLAAAPEDGPRVAELLGWFLGLEATDPEVVSLTQEQRRNAALTALNALLIKLGTKGPLLLSLEDLQWADDASLEWFRLFLETLSQYAEPTQVMILCQHRSELADLPRERWKLDFTSIHLRPLDPQDCLAIAAAILQTPPESVAETSPLGPIIQQVAGRAAGNPFYLHELLSALLDSKLIVPGADGQWMPAMTETDLKLPSTIHGAVAARLDRLPRDLKGLVQIGALLGRTFSLEMIEQVGKRDTDNLESLQALCRLGFLYRNSQGDFAFTQPLFQEVAYQSLLLSSRKEIHGRTGRALEAFYADRLEEQAHLLAHHYQLADQPGPALKFLYLAAKRSFDFYDLARARVELERAVDLMKGLPEQPVPAKWEVQWLLGQLLTLTSQYDAAFAALNAALELAADPSARANVLRTFGDAHERQGEYQAALDRYQQGLEALPTEYKLERAPLIAKMGYAKYRLGAHEDCIRLCSDALDLMDGSTMYKDQGFAHSYLGITYWRRGDTESAIQHTQFALAYREKCKDLAGIGTSYSNLANIYSDRGEWDRADEYYRRSLSAYERIGDPWYISLLHNNLGTLLLTRGNLDEAEGHFRKALELKQRIGGKQGIGIALFNIGDVLSQRGQATAALETMQQALGIFQELGSKEVFPEVYTTIGRVWLELGNLEQARTFLDQARQFAEEVSDDVTLAVIPRLQSQLHLLEGDVERAHASAEQAVALIQPAESPLDLGRAHAQLAHVLRYMGHQTAAHEATAKARQLFETLGAAFELSKLPIKSASGSPTV